MSILDINTKHQNKSFRNAIVVYLILSILAVIINQVYGIFSHGVASSAMTWMFLYLLIGGSVFYFFINLFASNINKFNGCRLFTNIYNSGIATLTFGSFLKGIIEIAGASSPYLIFFYIVGILFIAVGLILMFIMVINQKKWTLHSN